MVGAFLTGRKMSLKVGEERSSLRNLKGGVPQGSLLGVFLFNCLIDEFEADSAEVEQYQINGGQRHGQVRQIGENEDVLGLVEVPLEQHDPSTHTPVCQEEKIQNVKYVDDNVVHEKINMENADVTAPGERTKQAFRTQNLIRVIVHNAEEAEMLVNPKKTVMLCISDAASYKAKAFILDHEGEVVESQDHLKVLGFHFSNRPNMQAQVDSIIGKFTRKLWSLVYLRHRGFNEDELLQVYCTIILPSHDYCSTAYHHSLTRAQTQALERLQARALKSIYGYEYSYNELLEWTNLDRLEERRENRALNFARNCLGGRFAHWFPLHRPARATRSPLIYEEFHARCTRLQKSPLYSMRKMLNRAGTGG